MNTPAFDTFRNNASDLLSHINALDLILQIFKETIAGYQKQMGEKSKKATINISGVHPKDEKRYKEILGVVSVPISEVHQLASPTMYATCKYAMVSLITVVEEYLRGICCWIFEKRPETFKSEKQLELTYELIIELGNYEAIMNMLLNRILDDVSRDNVAESFRNLLGETLGWDVRELESGMTTLKDVSAVRNVIIHNQSKVDEIFMANISKPEDYKLGQGVIVNPSRIKENAYDIIELMRQIDEMVVRKCGK